LSALEKAAGRLPGGFVYALPTRRQWDFFLGDATFESHGFENAVTSRTRPMARTEPSNVGTMPPNQFGLHDVLGNVWEWCADGDMPDQKALKGGAYNNLKTFQFKPLERTTVRRASDDAKLPDAGFRCVMVPSH
jgi:formylglycine-generating enzyme required for sulfatase activity